ncbi:MAG: NADH-quinone oxidoreductase subunit NuoG [Planctomycetes bacterium]|nr:NADH-quinone oxidoreductase subunit NuoG [Planctomycetota bacterium]
MPTIYVEGQPYEVSPGLNLLHACLSLGFNIPYFCWHPAMHSVGACRQCAVKLFKDENDTKGKIVMSCMTLARDGTRISIADPQAVWFRKVAIEWLMLNHPHDCPVCDEGGECHLQDMTEMCGHVYRRTRFKKRTYRNQYLGPFLTHEMNRCIQCYRCVRFYRGYAGGRDFHTLAWHNSVYFGRHQDGVLQSKFSGNLVEVCPTGVFDDKTLARHYVRKWDLQTAPSICVHCALGCNTIPGARYGTLRRIRNRYNGDVNSYWLCDRGRYGYEFVNSPQRIRRPLLRNGDGRPTLAAKETALTQIGGVLRESRHVIGIGSARASLESNFALRCLVGPENFYLGTCRAEVQLLSAAIDVLRNGPVPSASLHEAAWADAVFVLGEDVPNVAPVLELALRQSTLRKPSDTIQDLHIEPWNDAALREAIQTEKGPLFLATTYSTDLDASATQAYHAAPQDIARLGFAVANLLDANAPSVPGLLAPIAALARQIAGQLAEARRPLVVAGVHCGMGAVLQAAANVAYALQRKNENTRICLAAPWCNSLGLGMMGGKCVDSAIDALRARGSTTLVVLESDLYRHLDVAEANNLLNTANHVVVLDSLRHKTTDKADFVLPAGTFAESTGTFVNNEGRAQRFFAVLPPAGEVQESWRWIGELLAASGQRSSAPWQTFDEIVEDLVRAMPAFAPVARAAPSADFRMAGQRIPRQSHRYSGRTAIHAAVNVHEPQPPADPDSPLAFSMEGYLNQPPSSLIPRFWAPQWNSVQAVNKFQEEVAGVLRGGNPGKRLIEPQADGQVEYFTEIPEAFERREGYLLVVPGYHVFGSEELSILSSGVAELAPMPYIAVNPEDAGKLIVRENGLVDVALSTTSHYLPVRIAPAVPPGLAVVPMGLPGIQWNGQPVWKKLLRT